MKELKTALHCRTAQSIWHFRHRSVLWRIREELFARTGDFLEKVVKPQLAQGKDILIVGHGAMNSSIVCQVKKLPLTQFWSAGIENCKLMQLC